MAAIIQGIGLLVTLPAMYVYSNLITSSNVERPIVFVVTLFGCFTGMFNVALTLNILLSHFKSSFYSPFAELATILGWSTS